MGSRVAPGVNFPDCLVCPGVLTCKAAQKVGSTTCESSCWAEAFHPGAMWVSKGQSDPQGLHVFKGLGEKCVTVSECMSFRPRTVLLFKHGDYSLLSVFC